MKSVALCPSSLRWQQREAPLWPLVCLACWPSECPGMVLNPSAEACLGFLCMRNGLDKHVRTCVCVCMSLPFSTHLCSNSQPSTAIYFHLTISNISTLRLSIMLHLRDKQMFIERERGSTATPYLCWIQPFEYDKVVCPTSLFHNCQPLEAADFHHREVWSPISTRRQIALLNTYFHVIHICVIKDMDVSAGESNGPVLWWFKSISHGH